MGWTVANTAKTPDQPPQKHTRHHWVKSSMVCASFSLALQNWFCIFKYIFLWIHFTASYALNLPYLCFVVVGFSFPGGFPSGPILVSMEMSSRSSISGEDIISDSGVNPSTQPPSGVVTKGVTKNMYSHLSKLTS